MTPLTSLTPTTLARMIREREVTPSAVLEAHLARIAGVNGDLRAVVAMDAEAARANAAAADVALLAGKPVGPLHGVPFTVKDWIETEGLPCAGGQESRRDFKPKRDATVVARLRAAGAVLIGKTKPGNDDAVYPHARNPYNLAHSPGGSSAGEAAIIAACGSPFGLGSDSGGSLRFPAHCCGIATLKPTAGRVPNTGHFPRVGGMSDPRSQIGPMARTVEDLGLLLSVIAGPDGRDPAAAPVPIGDPLAVEIRGLRVAVVEEVSGVRPMPDVAATLALAARALSEARADVDTAKPPRFDEALEITKGYWRRMASFSASDWRPYRETGLTGEESARLLWQWDRFSRDTLAFMESWDLVLMPAAPWASPKLGEESMEDFIYTLPFSLNGWPVAVVRSGTSDSGLPIGVQLAARPWRDDVALAAAAVVELATGGWQPPG